MSVRNGPIRILLCHTIPTVLFHGVERMQRSLVTNESEEVSGTQKRGALSFVSACESTRSNNYNNMNG